MIKKVSIVKTITDRFPINVDVLKFNPPIESNQYLVGGFYQTQGYSMYAFYKSDQNGNILNDIPYMHDEGTNTYAEIFQELGYTYI